MRKSIGRDDLQIKVCFVCPTTQNEVTQVVTNWDFTSYDNECECCGSHGEIRVDFKCESCEESHEYYIREW